MTFSTKVPAYETLVKNTADTHLATNQPESCRTYSSLSEQVALVLDLAVEVTYQ